MKRVNYPRRRRCDGAVSGASADAATPTGMDGDEHALVQRCPDHTERIMVQMKLAHVGGKKTGGALVQRCLSST